METPTGADQILVAMEGVVVCDHNQATPNMAPKNPQGADEISLEKVEETRFGPWMLVKRPGRRRIISAKNQASGSRLEDKSQRDTMKNDSPNDSRPRFSALNNDVDYALQPTYSQSNRKESQAYGINHGPRSQLAHNSTKNKPKNFAKPKGNATPKVDVKKAQMTLLQKGNVSKENEVHSLTPQEREVRREKEAQALRIMGRLQKEIVEKAASGVQVDILAHP